MPSPSIPSKTPWRFIAPVLVLTFAFGLVGLGQRDLWAPDEPKYALVAREMIETGNFLLPHVNGAPYPDKPPLLFWSIALASSVTGGVGQPAAILPSLIAALLTLAGTARLVVVLRPESGRLAVLLATGLLAVSFRFVNQATFGQIDMLLTACTTWAFVFLVEAGSIHRDDARFVRHVVAGFALMGLGTLAKGPVALILPLGGLLLGAWLAGAKIPWRIVRSARGWGAFVAVVALWLIPAAAFALWGGHRDWLENLLFKQTVVRYASSWHHHEPFYYFLIVPWHDFFPSIALLPAALASLWNRARSPEALRAARFLAGACLFTLVFFSIPRGKRSLYLLPAYPWLAAWLGLDLAERLEAAKSRLGPVRVSLGLLALVVTLIAVALPIFEQRKAAELGIDVLLWPPVAVLGLIAGALVVAVASPRRMRAALAVVGVGWALFYGVFVAVAYPAIDASRSAKLFIDEVEQRVVDDAQPAMLQFRAQFGFYAGRMLEAHPSEPASMERVAERLAGPDPFWVLMKDHFREELEPYLDPEHPPVLIHDRLVGDDHYVVLGNEAALDVETTSRR